MSSTDVILKCDKFYNFVLVYKQAKFVLHIVTTVILPIIFKAVSKQPTKQHNLYK